MGSDARTTEKVYTCQRAVKEIPFSEPKCVEPKAYCKWRTSCPINLLEKKGARKP